jgi:uncharacterized protein (TIGR02271 family)
MEGPACSDLTAESAARLNDLVRRYLPAAATERTKRAAAFRKNAGAALPRATPHHCVFTAYKFYILSRGAPAVGRPRQFEGAARSRSTVFLDAVGTYRLSQRRREAGVAGAPQMLLSRCRYGLQFCVETTAGQLVDKRERFMPARRARWQSRVRPSRAVAHALQKGAQWQMSPRIRIQGRRSTMADRSTIIAVFDDHTRAQRAIEQLKRAGFTEREIGVTTRDGEADGGQALRDGGKGTHAKEGAITGVTAGAGVGALWGLGILAGVLPAIGPAIAGGTLAAILSSAAAGAATAGLAGSLIGLGIPEDEAKYYEEEFRAGRTVVTVQAMGRQAEAEAILRDAGGRTMDSAGNYASSSATASGGAAANTRGRTVADSGTRTIEAREEEVHVRKRPVQTGEAEIYKEVRTEHRSIDVPVKKEELVIERHAVGRQPASGPVGESERVRIPLSEEQVEVDKRTVATERVEVGKRLTEDEEHLDTTVRKEDIKVNKRGRGTTPRHTSR